MSPEDRRMNALGQKIRPDGSKEAMDFSHVRLGIAIPHRNGDCHIAVLRTFAAADMRGIRASLLDNSAPSVAQNRNILVQQFLNHPFGGTHLFFLDTDMGLPPDGIKKLIAADSSIVSGLCVDKLHSRLVLRKRIGRYRYVQVQEGWCKYKPGEGPPWIIKDELRDKVLPCDATGAACLLIKREVLETMSYPWFFEDYDPEASGHEATSMVSEDLSFFYKAKQAGFQGYVHTGVLVDHWQGTIKFPPYWHEGEAN